MIEIQLDNTWWKMRFSLCSINPLLPIWHPTLVRSLWKDPYAHLVTILAFGGQNAMLSEFSFASSSPSFPLRFLSLRNMKDQTSTVTMSNQRELVRFQLPISLIIYQDVK